MNLSTSLAIKAIKIRASAQSPLSVASFIQQRRDGAATIAQDARAKGGLSTLTAIHFEAKLPVYDAALTAVNTEPPVQVINSLKFMETSFAQSIATATSMERFQALTGKQEVVGEIILFLENPQVY
jgi:hypothetical protein